MRLKLLEEVEGLCNNIKYNEGAIEGKRKREEGKEVTNALQDLKEGIKVSFFTNRAISSSVFVSRSLG